MSSPCLKKNSQIRTLLLPSIPIAACDPDVQIEVEMPRNSEEHRLPLLCAAERGLVNHEDAAKPNMYVKSTL